MKYLFIAEKPSLMNDVKQCYNKHLTEISLKVGEIDFIALSGHVCTLKTPNEYSTWSDYKWYEIDYPMIPDDFLIKAIDDNNKKKVINKIQTISKKYDGIIVGTDSDVEGYGIYYLLEKLKIIFDPLKSFKNMIKNTY